MPKEKKVVIVVKQDKYYVDDKEVTLTEIEALVTGEENVIVTLENNYASVEAWDNLRTKLYEWKITVVEE